MAAAGAGFVAGLESRVLLRRLSFCVLLAGEASPTREFHSVRSTLRIGPAAGAAVSLLVPVAPLSPRPVNPCSLTFPRQKFPRYLDLKVPSPQRHVGLPHFLLQTSWTLRLYPDASFAPVPQAPHPQSKRTFVSLASFSTRLDVSR